MYSEKKELEEFQTEILVLETKTESYKNSMVESLVNSNLGNNIRETLRNPVKVTRFQIFKMKLKDFKDRLLDIL
jgi:hypothetical protein